MSRQYPRNGSQKLLASAPAKILAGAQGERDVVEDYRPLADSLEWELGQRYWQERGSQAFISEMVPFVINNDGNLSRSEADLVFAGLCATEPAPDIYVLEIGAGVGLFARFFLDAFQGLCRQHGKDFYERMHYVLADRSERMLRDACRNGIFANHPGRYLLRVADATSPETLLDSLPAASESDRRLHAVFLNYILDCLPTTALRFDEGKARHLCARTCVARGLDLREYTDLAAEDLTQRAQSSDPEQRRELVKLSEVLATEYAYLPVELKEVPYGDFVAGIARAKPGYILHNYGAIQCIERLLKLIDKRGFVLVNDYGSNKDITAEDGIEHQRFSGSTACGLNFPLLKAYFGDQKRCQWVEPKEDNESIYARLLGHKLPQPTMDAFHRHFGKAAYDRLHQPQTLARSLINAGRFEAAASAYGTALEEQPGNWVLMAEVAKFLTFTLKSPNAGLALAKAALALNPACSADLWNTLGDSHFYLGELEEARKAFIRALQINPKDVRAFFNLSFVFAQKKDYASALKMIARGLALDQTGEYREGLLQKQAEILGALARRQQRTTLLMANRVSKTVGKEGGPLIAQASAVNPLVAGSNPPGTRPATAEPMGFTPTPR